MEEIIKMAEEAKDKKPQLNYDWRKLELAEVAESYLKDQGERGIPYAQKSLELLLEDIGVKDSWLVKTISDPQVIQKTIKNQLEFYNKYQQEETVGDLLKYHSKTLEGYLKADSKKAFEEFKSFENKKYSDIEKEVAKAQYMIKGKKQFELGSDEDIKKYEKTIKKYEKVMTVVSILKAKNKDELRRKVDDAQMKDSFKYLFSEEYDKDYKKAA